MQIKLKDGTVFKPDKMMQQAIKIRQKEVPKFLDKMPTLIDKHWKAKTVPTKFGWDSKWADEFMGQESYKDQAELAPKVMYQYVRPIMMGLMMQKLAKMQPKKKGEKKYTPKVIALGKDGKSTEYPSGKKVRMPWDKKRR